MKTKFGIVGCGFMGGIVASAWKNGLLADYELVGVTSRSPESAQKMAETVGCPACADVDALLAAAQLDGKYDASKVVNLSYDASRFHFKFPP